jgi:hypothetical protein
VSVERDQSAIFERISDSVYAGACHAVVSADHDDSLCAGERIANRVPQRLERVFKLQIGKR